MMALLGTIVNSAAIIAGALLGVMIPGMRNSLRATVMQGLGIAVIVLGVTMALQSENFIILALSVVLGGIIGELLRLEQGLENAGKWLEKRVRFGGRGGKGSKGSISAGFVTATLVYCVGAMTILGAMDSGLRNDHAILYTKALLDGFTAIIFASTLGIGVLFSAIPVFLYQGSIALLSSSIVTRIDPASLEAIITEVTAVGGVSIIGIGLNILEIKKIHVGNMLPALAFAAAAVPLAERLSALFG